MVARQSWSSVALAAMGMLVVLTLQPSVVRGQNDRSEGLSESEFDSLRQECDLRRQRWATIPWKTSMTEARDEAAETGKPLFMVVTTGNCLGYT